MNKSKKSAGRPRGKGDRAVKLRVEQLLDPHKLKLYSVVVLCLMLFLGIILLFSSISLRRQAFDANVNLARNEIRHVVRNLNDRLLENYTRLSQLSKDEDIFWFKNWSGFSDREKIARYSRASVQVANLRNMTEEAVNVYACYPAQGIVLSTGVYAMDDFDVAPNSWWQSLPNTSHNLRTESAASASGVRMTALHMLCKIGNNPKTVGFVVLTLKPEPLFQSAFGSLQFPGVAFRAIDASGTLLHTSGAPSWTAWENLEAAGVDSNASLDGVRYIRFSESLDIAGWLLDILLPYASLNESPTFSQNLVLIIILAVIAALTGTLFIVQFFFSPIDKLCLLIAGGSSADTQPNPPDKIAFLSSQIHSLLGENTSMTNWIHENKPYLRERLLLQVVMGTSNTQITRQSLESLDIQLMHPLFRVFVVQYETDDAELNAASFIREEIFESFWLTHLQEAKAYMVCFQPNRYFLLLNYAEEPEGAQGWPETLAAALQVLRGEYHSLTTGGLSRPADSREGLNRAFQEANYALEQQLLIGKGFIGQPSLKRNDLITLYPFEIMSRLVNALQGYDEALIHELLLELDAWFGQKPLGNRFLIGQVFMSMSEDIRRCIKTLHIDDFEAQAMDHACQAILGAQEMAGCLKAFASLCQIIRQIYRGAQSQRNNQLASDIQAYIQEHFDSVESVECLATQFMISQTQLYAVFKECLQTTPAQYISDVRMQQAAIMLRTTRLPIQEIALRCGIENEQRFFRNFKKGDGCTPAAYRKMQAFADKE